MAEFDPTDGRHWEADKFDWNKSVWLQLALANCDPTPAWGAMVRRNRVSGAN
jgi:hypothetical protein